MGRALASGLVTYMRRRLLVLACVLPLACGRKPEPAAPVPASGETASATRILQFYSAPNEIDPGGSASLCYGVENAARVFLDPPVETLSPSLTRCVPVAPKATTQYTLTAEGRNGERVRRTARVIVSRSAPASPPAVDPGRPRVVSFLAQQNDVPSGTSVMFCYEVADGEPRVMPEVAKLAGSRRGCFTVTAETTREYTLVAVGDNNIIDRKSVVLRVR